MKQDLKVTICILFTIVIVFSIYFFTIKPKKDAISKQSTCSEYSTSYKAVQNDNKEWCCCPNSIDKCTSKCILID